MADLGFGPTTPARIPGPSPARKGGDGGGRWQRAHLELQATKAGRPRPHELKRDRLSRVLPGRQTPPDRGTKIGDQALGGEWRHLLGRDLQSLGQPARNLPQKHTGLGAWVEELYCLVGPEVCAFAVRRPRIGQCVEHPVRKFGRGKYLVVGEVRNTRQDVGIASTQSKAGLLIHKAAWSTIVASSLTVIGG